MAGITFNDLENGHHYKMVEPDESIIEAGRLYKIQNYNSSNDDYVKIINTRAHNGRPIYMEAFVKVIPGTIFLEDTDPDTDPEFPDEDDVDREFFNITAEEYADNNFKAGLRKAFDKVEHPEIKGGEKQKSKKQKSKKQKSKKQKSKKTKSKKQKSKKTKSKKTKSKKQKSKKQKSKKNKKTKK